MMDEAGGRGAYTAPRSLDELWALRTDYEDVAVASLGGTVLRLYALTGLGRGRLIPDMASLSERDATDPATVAAIWAFQTRVVAASLGYVESMWDALGATLGVDAIDQLYAVAARLSGLDASAQAKATERLRRRRSAASGTD